jgi:sugar phosphate isomerase/epimerase
MDIGVSTACFYPEETERALRRCGEMGVLCTEIFFNAPSELKGPLLREMAQIRSAYNMRIVSVHPFTSSIEPYLLFSRYERRYRDGLDFYLRYAEAAAALGAGIVVLHGGRDGDRELSPEEYTDRFLELDRILAREGVRLAQENVNNYAACHPEFLRTMRHLSQDTVRFVCDVKQAVRAGHTPLEILDAMGPCVAHVHLSDHGKDGDCLLPGRGCFDFANLFSRLQQMHYQGDAVVEVYRSAFAQAGDLADAWQWLQKQYAYTMRK